MRADRGTRPHSLAGAVMAALAVLLAGSDPVTSPGPRTTPGARRTTPPPAASPAPPPPRRATRTDDLTFRPTVLVRRGKSQGTGSVIASVHGETLVLTVAHVVADPGDTFIEVYRYNLGVENTRAPGPWPRLYRAEIVATDPAADVAILRVRGHQAMPYVARIASGDKAAPPGTVVTSLGIDLATHLSSWTTTVFATVRADLKQKGAERPFLITDRGPEHGRSGGGLFLADGRLVGVCVGRVEKTKDRWIGVFAPVESVHRIIREEHLEAAITRSEQFHLAGGRAPRPAVTETRHESDRTR